MSAEDTVNQNQNNTLVSEVLQDIQSIKEQAEQKAKNDLISKYKDVYESYMQNYFKEKLNEDQSINDKSSSTEEEDVDLTNNDEKENIEDKSNDSDNKETNDDENINNQDTSDYNNFSIDQFLDIILKNKNGSEEIEKIVQGDDQSKQKDSSSEEEVDLTNYDKESLKEAYDNMPEDSILKLKIKEKPKNQNFMSENKNEIEEIENQIKEEMEKMGLTPDNEYTSKSDVADGYDHKKPDNMKVSEDEESDEPSMEDIIKDLGLDGESKEESEKRGDYDEEQGDIPGEQDTGPDEYKDEGYHKNEQEDDSSDEEKDKKEKAYDDLLQKYNVSNPSELSLDNMEKFFKDYKDKVGEEDELDEDATINKANKRGQNAKPSQRPKRGEYGNQVKESVDKIKNQVQKLIKESKAKEQENNKLKNQIEDIKGKLYDSNIISEKFYKTATILLENSLGMEDKKQVLKTFKDCKNKKEIDSAYQNLNESISSKTNKSDSNESIQEKVNENVTHSNSNENNDKQNLNESEKNDGLDRVRSLMNYDRSNM